VAAGVRQVEDGDFEGAVTTLEAAIAGLRGNPGRVHLLVQADIQLAVAQVALDHTAQAIQAFTEALALNPDLRLSEDRFSPKVLPVSRTARDQAAQRSGTARRRSSGGRALLIGGGVAVAGGTAAILAARGGTTLPTFSAGRFGTPALDCPNGSENLRLPFTILVEASNPSGSATAIPSVARSGAIEISHGFPGEVGFRSSKESTVVPGSIPARQNVTLQVSSFLLCGNGEGDPGRFNEWSGALTVTTSVGVFMVD